MGNIIGPGSLYTSVIPNLLVPEITEAIAPPHPPGDRIRHWHPHRAAVRRYKHCHFYSMSAPAVPLHYIRDRTHHQPAIASCIPIPIGPGHGDTNIIIFTDNLLMPCPYIIFAIASPHPPDDRIPIPIPIGPVYGDTNIVIFTPYLLLPYTYIIFAIAYIP